VRTTFSFFMLQLVSGKLTGLSGPPTDGGHMKQ